MIRPRGVDWIAGAIYVLAFVGCRLLIRSLGPLDVPPPDDTGPDILIALFTGTVLFTLVSTLDMSLRCTLPILLFHVMGMLTGMAGLSWYTEAGRPTSLSSLAQVIALSALALLTPLLVGFAAHPAVQRLRVMFSQSPRDGSL
jgi:hypothetical protein